MGIVGAIVQTRVPPVPCEHSNQLRVLRGIATLELAKGMVVLFAAIGVVLVARNEDPWDMADGLLRLLHISPDHHFAQAFLNWADTLTDAKLYMVAAAGVGYSILRFLEAYGLWNARAWAEWIALISGALYLPFEIYNLVHRASWFHVVVLTINIAIVLYMAYLLKTGKSRHRVPRLPS
jgi:uncharacterized membrane protein (DUF2068 family)